MFKPCLSLGNIPLVLKPWTSVVQWCISYICFAAISWGFVSCQANDETQPHLVSRPVAECFAVEQQHSCVHGKTGDEQQEYQ